MFPIPMGGSEWPDTGRLESWLAFVPDPHGG